MTKGILIPADPSRTLSIIELDGLEDYQAAVGGFIEAVDGSEFTAWLNEEGKWQGLALNRRADKFLHAAVPGLAPEDRIVGDVVLTGLPDSKGEARDAPARWVAEVEAQAARA